MDSLPLKNLFYLCTTAAKAKAFVTFCWLTVLGWQFWVDRSGLVVLGRSFQGVLSSD